MEQWRGKVAVVTGASAGIGEAIAELLVDLGLNVVGLARRLDRLDELKKKVDGKSGKFFPLKADMTKEEDLLSAFQWVEKNLGGVHILVNNAGTTMKPTLIEATDTASWKTLYETNIIGLQICSREAIKSMRVHNIDDGYIINISSVASHMSSPHPCFVSYFASKKAVTTISEGLRVELGLSKSKIRVTNISPGYVKTEIFQANEIKMPDAIPGLESADVARTLKFLLELPPNVLISEITLQDVRCTKQVIEENLKKLKL